MLENDEHKEKKKKKNFTESEIEVLLAEVEVRAGTLFESLFSGLSHKNKMCGMAVYSLGCERGRGGGQQRSLKDVKKKKNEITVQKNALSSHCTVCNIFKKR